MPVYPYLVKSGALRLVLDATGAAAAIGLAIELHGLRKASAHPLPRGFA
jgi:hypothetical protein